MILSDFRVILPQFQSTQQETITWLTQAYQSIDPRFSALVSRYVCKPTRVGSRYHALKDFTHSNWDQMKIFNLEKNPAGENMQTRMDFFASVAQENFRRFYAEEMLPPEEIIHVTCTGYVSPSAAQLVVSEKNWGEKTQVMHAYHMGCYAAIPAIKQAQRAKNRIDIVHTELCSLHFNPSIRTPEQLVVQGLFADGMIRYSATPSASNGLEVLKIHEEIIPETSNDMTWSISTDSMQMTLARDISKSIAAYLPGYLQRLCGDQTKKMIREAVFAIHPGGPQIIDDVSKTLDLNQKQIQHSEKILFERGNMSSATIPHIWNEILNDSSIPDGQHIVSLAFGPGLTIAGALLRKKS